jgi:hypothetical protein
MLIVLVVLPIHFLLPTPCYAEDAFSWKDAAGRTVYGSKPPKGSQSVKGLKTKALSRYSSDKVLRHLGWSEKQKVNSEGLSESEIDLSSEQSPTDPVPSFEPAELQAAAAHVELSETGDIVNCSVEVSNIGTREAIDVSIAFEFADGTLTPGIGPDRISANASAKYAIPPELLPFSVRSDLDQDPVSAPPVPKVIVNSATALN